MQGLRLSCDDAAAAAKTQRRGHATMSVTRWGPCDGRYDAPEAVSQGVPVVSTNCGDIDSVIVNGHNGFLSKRSKDSLLKSMKIARELDEVEYVEMSRNAIASANKFEVSNISNQLISSYKKTVGL